MADVSEKRLGLLMVMVANVVIPPTMIVEYRSREVARTPAVIACILVAVVVNAGMLLYLRLLSRRLGRPLSQSLVILAIVLGVLSACVAMYGVLAGIDERERHATHLFPDPIPCNRPKGNMISDEERGKRMSKSNSELKALIEEIA